MKKIRQFFSNKKNLPLIVTLSIILVVLLGTGIYVARQSGKNDTVGEDGLPTTEVIPTVDSSTVVTLTPKNGKKEVLLSVKGIPNGTTSLEYSISYNTTENIEGTGGEVETKGKSTYEQKIVLGTASRNIYRYHNVVGPIRVDIVFSGSYGKKQFGHDFNL